MDSLQNGFQQYLESSGLPLENYKVSSLCEFKGSYYVSLEFEEEHPDYYRNVWKYSKSGQKLWQSKEFKINNRGDVSLKVFVSESGELMVYCSIGYFANLDPETGAIDPIVEGRPW